MNENEMTIIPATPPALPKQKPKPKKKKKSIEKKEMKPAHIAFIKEYVRNMGNATRAYMAVYPKASYGAAREAACGLLTKANIKKAIDAEYKKLWDDKDTDLEKSKTLQMIKELGNSNVFDVVDLKDGTLFVKSLDEIPIEAQNSIMSIEKIRKETDKGIDEVIKVKLHPKLQALELRAKIQGLLQEKVEHSGTIEIVPAARPEDEEE